MAEEILSKVLDEDVMLPLGPGSAAPRSLANRTRSSKMSGSNREKSSGSSMLRLAGLFDTGLPIENLYIDLSHHLFRHVVTKMGKKSTLRPPMKLVQRPWPSLKMGWYGQVTHQDKQTRFDLIWWTWNRFDSRMYLKRGATNASHHFIVHCTIARYGKEQQLKTS